MPHTEAATLKAVLLPDEEAPLKWKPPESSPASVAKLGAKAVAIAKTRRELPETKRPIEFRHHHLSIQVIDPTPRF